jgi:hypothetical protein
MPEYVAHYHDDVVASRRMSCSTPVHTNAGTSGSITQSSSDQSDSSDVPGVGQSVKVRDRNDVDVPFVHHRCPDTRAA